MKRALKSITIEEDAKVTLADFVSLNEKFPAIFIPAFLLQDSFRNKVCGYAFQVVVFVSVTIIIT